jgi:hypothetical protein
MLIANVDVNVNTTIVRIHSASRCDMLFNYTCNSLPSKDNQSHHAAVRAQAQHAV